MRKIAALVLLLSIAVFAIACSPHGTVAFGVEAGKAAIAEAPEPTLPTCVQRQYDLSAGLRLAAEWGEMGALVGRTVGDTTLYGVVKDGVEVLPARYVQLGYTGAFYVGRYYADDSLLVEVYDAAGTLLVGVDDSSARVGAVGKDYFMLYTDQNAQLFDKTGTAVFREGILTPADAVSVCGDYFLSANAASGSFAIWDGPNIVRRRFAAPDVRYSVAYMGGRFLITALSVATADDYTYIETDNGTRFMRQEAWWYDADLDRLTSVQLDYVLLSVYNEYTPALSPDEWQAMHLREGYSVAVVAECNAYGVHDGDRYYAMDGNAALQMRYPQNIPASAILYRAERGFVGSAAAGGAAALYDYAGNLVWQDKAHTYATMSWQSGRLVASFVQDGVAYYGAFDSEGQVAVDFVYRYMSPYREGRCVALDASGYVVLSGAGEVLARIDPVSPEYWHNFGIYAYRDGGKIGLKNWKGDIVAPAVWESMTAVGYNAEGNVYAVAQEGETQTILVLQ